MSNYIVNFVKSAEHNYGNFFSTFNNNHELKKAKEEIASLNRMLREKTAAYTMLLNKRYSSLYTETTQSQVLHYESRDQTDHYFDVETGMKTYKAMESKTVSLDTKAGEFALVTGYCFELGAVLVKHYSYNINGNNTKVNMNLKGEYLCPMFDIGNYVSYFENGNFSEPTRTSANSHMVNYALERINAGEFIKAFYGIDKPIAFSLHQMRKYINSNKSFEIIIRTCEDAELAKILLDIASEEAVPLHTLAGCSKQEWKYAEELGVLKKFISFKNSLKTDTYYARESFRNANQKTNMEWIEFLDKCQRWEDDLRFYGISYRNNLVKTLLQAYHGGEYPFHSTIISQHYAFGKFCNYVIEEVVNQGYTSLESFIRTLIDYISMCKDMEVKPTLYSSYLHQTHDIMARNHKIQLNAMQEQTFAERYKDIKKWEHDEYAIITPKTSNELKAEGDQLNHCVASYIKRVVDGECLIFFLRNAKDVETPLVTIELRGKNVVQARGAHNRRISEDERFAIYRWAKARGYTAKV